MLATARDQAALSVAILSLVIGCAREAPHLRLATTTSVDNSGLLESLVEPFHAETGLSVDVLAVGSGRALQLLRRGDADLAITHDPEAEAAFLREGRGARYRKLMFNDFLLVGPPSDPASVRLAPDAVQAMRAIARSGSTFISRGDESGTHARERTLWAGADAAPPRERLLETGQGMAATLRIASEQSAYCLTDRATFLQLTSTLRLVPVFEGDPVLLNTYGVLVIEGPRQVGALRLATWLSEGSGRRLIAAFAAGGPPPFTPWPADRSADDPRALPR